MPLPAPLRPLPSLAALVLASACSSPETPPPAPPTVLVQSVARAAPGSAIYTGEVRARHEFDLGFRVGGKMIARQVDVGSEVKAGQPLARLDPADLELAASAARAQLAAAESDLQTSQAERERYAGMLAKKFVSQAAFDAKDNAYNAARARLEQARAQSRISGNQADYGTLSSTTPAVVTAVLADAGQVVSAGQAVFRLARPDEKEVAIAVPESRLAELKAAKRISVQLWAAPAQAINGELRELAPAADPATRTYAARIRLLAASPDARLGMTARVALGETTTAPLLVPLSAIVDQGNGPLVWVVNEGKVTPRPVMVTAFREDGATVAEGLQPGEQVVVAGTAKLVAGQAVRTRPLTPPGEQR